MALDLKTFDEFYDDGVNAVTNSATGITYFDKGSVIRALLEATSFYSEFLQQQTNTTYLARLLDQAKGDDLSQLALNFNVNRKSAQASTGIVTFSRSTPATGDFTIVAGQTVSTEVILDGSAISYTVSSNILFSSGASSVTGVVECTQTGNIGNVASGKITVNTSAIPGIDSLTNTQPFGYGRIEETDEELRLRVRNTLLGLKRGNKQAILEAATSVSDVSYAKIVENTPQTGMFTVFITSPNGVVSDATKTAVSGAVEAARGFCVPFTIAANSIQYITISATITKTDPNIDETELASGIIGEIERLISVSVLNELFISDLIVMMKGIEGVLNVRNVLINGSSSDFSTEEYEVIRMFNPSTDITFTFVDPD